MKTTTWIYTIIERIYSDNIINIYNYSNYELAIKRYNELKDYYIDNYSIYIDKDNSYIDNDPNNPSMDIFDIANIELFYNDLDKEIL